MCSRILWLDHGKQICFSDKVEQICDAYEEFLITKKVPESPDGIERMAADYQERLAAIEAEKKKSEQEKLLDMLQQSDHAAATKAAKDFLSAENK